MPLLAKRIKAITIISIKTMDITLKIAYTEKRDRTLFERGFMTKYVKHNQSKEKIDECFSPRVRVTNVIIGGIAVDGD